MDHSHSSIQKQSPEARPVAREKWPIPETGRASDEERRFYWQELYASRSNDEVVFSMTADKEVQRCIFDALDLSRPMDVLIPGCGSAVDLQVAMIDGLHKECKIVCTDFASAAIERARANFRHPRLTYHCWDTSNVDQLGLFDAIVIVNSILSDSDQENRRMIRSCARALRSDGVFVGLFPTVYCGLEIATLENNPEKFAKIDLGTSTIHDRIQGVRQIFYTPLHLKRILREAGLRLAQMSIFFCDTEHFIEQGKRLYKIFDEDLSTYELYVVAFKST